MKTFFVTFGLLAMLFLLDNQQAFAKKSPSKLSTDLKFDGMSVKGQKQAPLGATASVETEKSRPSLIDYRTDYNDRIERSKTGR